MCRQLTWAIMDLDINGERLNHLRFADDMVLITDDVRQMLQKLNKKTKENWLKINIEETKIMSNFVLSDNLKIAREPIKQVGCY